jgi:hypothetical protein
MNPTNLSTPMILAIVIGLLFFIGIVAYLAMQKRRSTNLRAQFGPEYERAVSEGGDRRLAETKLAKRAERVRSFHLRPLTSADRVNFLDAWNRVQANFVDNPSAAVAEADQLLGQVMSARGYPVADFEQRAADISVDHPVVVQNYRTAHEIALRHTRGEASTEDLRKAMIHYRGLFEDLVAEPALVESKAVARVEAEGPAIVKSDHGSRGAAA